MSHITHVAIIRNGITYSLPSPNRHHNVLWIMPKKTCEDEDVQGFMDEHGKFLTREEAFIVAKTSGQLQRRSGGYDGNLLFSEDIW